MNQQKKSQYNNMGDNIDYKGLSPFFQTFKERIIEMQTVIDNLYNFKEDSDMDYIHYQADKIHKNVIIWKKTSLKMMKLLEYKNNELERFFGEI
jgi:hypothetical protein